MQDGAGLAPAGYQQPSTRLTSSVVPLLCVHFRPVFDRVRLPHFASVWGSLGEAVTVKVWAANVRLMS